MSRATLFFQRIQVRTWAEIVLLAALVERLVLFLVYQPVGYNDTGSYRRLAQAILDGWGRYDGTRLPGYPIFLALLGADRNVYLAQLVLGLLTTLLVFYIGWRLSGRGWFGALLALAHSLNLQQLFFEADLLTETLSTFFLVLAVAAMLWLLAEGERPLWQALLAGGLVGAASALSGLTRPLFVFMPVWAAFCLLVLWRARLRLRWGAALAAGLLGLALIGTWVAYMHQHVHRWTLSTMTGYHLVQHTGAFFEYVPDQYSAIRDTYLQYRAQRIAATGSPGNAIWDAIPALEKASGLSFYDLSDTLARISIQLILHHPLLYLKSVAVGWVWGWKAAVYWSADAFNPAWLAKPMPVMILAERCLLVAANLAFILGSLALVWKKVRGWLKMDAFLWFSLSFVWLTSIAQTMLDHGDNPRFLVPVQTLVVMVVLYWGLRIYLILRNKNEKPAA